MVIMCRKRWTVSITSEGVSRLKEGRVKDKGRRQSLIRGLQMKP